MLYVVGRLIDWCHEANKPSNFDAMPRDQVCSVLVDWLIDLRSKPRKPKLEGRRSRRLNKTLPPELKSGALRPYLSFALSWIQSVWKEAGRTSDLPIVLDEDADFAPLYNCLRHKIQELDEANPDLGKPRDFLSREDEALIRKFIDLNRPDHRLWATMFSVGSRACLRGGELCKLMTSQVSRGSDDQGDFFLIEIRKAKEIKVTLNSETSKPRRLKTYCLNRDDHLDAYRLLDEYLPQRSMIPENRFWLTPKTVVKEASPLLRRLRTAKGLSGACSLAMEAGVLKHIIPHSFRATGVTRMIEAGIPEQQARQRTGHSSSGGFGAYVRQSSSRAKELDESIAFEPPRKQARRQEWRGGSDTRWNNHHH